MTNIEACHAAHGQRNAIARTVLASRELGEVIVSTVQTGGGLSMRGGHFTIFETRVFGCEFPGNYELKFCKQ